MARVTAQRVARSIHNHESVYVEGNGCRDWQSHLSLAESICADLPKPDKARLIQAVAAVLGPLYELGSAVAEADAEVVVDDIWPLLCAVPLHRKPATANLSLNRIRKQRGDARVEQFGKVLLTALGTPRQQSDSSNVAAALATNAAVH
jgi:hypothetical protein